MSDNTITLNFAINDDNGSWDYKVLERIEWFGNMYFEGVVVSLEDAQRIAEYLRERGYEPEEGMSELFDAWTEGKPIVLSGYENRRDMGLYDPDMEES